MMPSPFASAKLRTTYVQYPPSGYPGTELRRRRTLGIDVRNGRADRHEHERYALERPRTRRPPRSTERESTQRSGVGRRARDPRRTEAGVGRAPVQLLEPVVT